MSINAFPTNHAQCCLAIVRQAALGNLNLSNAGAEEEVEDSRVAHPLPNGKMSKRAHPPMPPPV